MPLTPQSKGNGNLALIVSVVVAIFGTGGAGAAWFNQRGELEEMKGKLKAAEATSESADQARKRAEDAVAKQAAAYEQAKSDLDACRSKPPAGTSVANADHGGQVHAGDINFGKIGK